MYVCMHVCLYCMYVISCGEMSYNYVNVCMDVCNMSMYVLYVMICV